MNDLYGMKFDAELMNSKRNINNKLEEEFKQNFLKDFWKDILPNHYDKIYFEDKVHLNKDSYDKFYDKINTFI